MPPRAQQVHHYEIAHYSLEKTRTLKWRQSSNKTMPNRAWIPHRHTKPLPTLITKSIFAEAKDLAYLKSNFNLRCSVCEAGRITKPLKEIELLAASTSLLSIMPSLPPSARIMEKYKDSVIHPYPLILALKVIARERSFINSLLRC